MKYTCKDIHPGSLVLIASWANNSYVQVKVKMVAENYFIDENDNKYSYLVIETVYD